jgi:hypothetical protein
LIASGRSETILPMNITASAHFCTHEDGLHDVFVGGVSEPKQCVGSMPEDYIGKSK